MRWTGFVKATATGSFQFQTKSNDGVRLWVNGALVIDSWAAHSTRTDLSPPIALVKDQRYPSVMEHSDNSATAVARLFWKTPTATGFVAVPTSRLYAN